MVENVESRFWAPFIASSQRSSNSDIPPPPTSTPVIAPPALTLSLDPTEQMEDVRFPRLLDHGNIENTFFTLIQNPNG